MVGRQLLHPLPDRLAGEGIQDLRLKQMERQAPLIEAGVQQAGQDVGSVRRDPGAVHPGVEHPPRAGDSSLHPDLSGDRSDQVRAAHQRPC